MRQHGLTLVELLITIAVSAILLGIGVPGYSYLMDHSRLAGITNEMVGALSLARSEAIKRGIRVTVCKGDPMAATPSCQPSASWEQGWLVFVDTGTPGEIDGTDEIIRVREAIEGGASITTSNFTKYVSYMPSGVSRGPNNLPNGSLSICLRGNLRKIVLNTTGRARLEKGVC
jgi:type IV fimbrial biogenesis protein FimT